MKSRVVAAMAVLLVSAQLLLVLVSWLLSATVSAAPVRSLLTGEGIRWFLGSFVETMQSPLLVWILLLSMAYGCAVRASRSSSEGRRIGLRSLWLALILLLVYISGLLLLLFLPHAVLLSATGSVFPSPFSRALVPLIALGVVLASLAYGFSARAFRRVADVTDALVCGLAGSAPLLLLYVLAMQLYGSFRFVLFLG